MATHYRRADQVSPDRRPHRPGPHHRPAGQFRHARGSHRDAQPDRSSAQFLQGFPPEGSSRQQAQERGPAGRFQRSVPDRELRREDQARVRRLRDRRAEAQPARMPAREPDFRRAALRHVPPARGQERQGRARVHGRAAAHGAPGHLHHQRRGARRGQPAAPLARHLLRVEPARQRQGALQLPHHSRSRFLARGHVRHERFALRPSGSSQAPPEVSRHHVPPRAGLFHRRGNHQAFLHHRRPEAEARPRRRGDRHQGAHRGDSRHAPMPTSWSRAPSSR